MLGELREVCMAELASWSVMGPGLIGSELLTQVGKSYVSERLGLKPEPDFVANSQGFWEPDSEFPSNGETRPTLEVPYPYQSLDDIPDEKFPDYHFVAIPSSNDGEIATAFLDSVLERGAAAITAEKGAIANNYLHLKAASDNFRRLGITATVGGGTRLVEAVRLYTREDPANVTQIHLALNGTLSYVMSMIGPRGQGVSAVSRGQAVDQAIQLGYAEPGSEKFEEVVKGEAEGDIPKKTAILFNHLGLGGEEILDWHSLRFTLEDHELKRVAREARIRRFVVSMYAKKFHELVNPEEEDIIGGFNTECNGFQIVGGFQNVDTGVLDAFGRIVGPGNGAVIGLGPKESDGIFTTGFGPGAGPAPTVNTMLDDYLRISRYANSQ